MFNVLNTICLKSKMVKVRVMTPDVGILADKVAVASAEISKMKPILGIIVTK